MITRSETENWTKSKSQILNGGRHVGWILMGPHLLSYVSQRRHCILSTCLILMIIVWILTWFFIIYQTDAVTITASIFIFSVILSTRPLLTHWSQPRLPLFSTGLLPQPSLSLSLSPCSSLPLYGSLRVSLSVSDSQWVDAKKNFFFKKKASLQIRAGRSTRSLEYRTARAQRHSDTYLISQRTRLWVCERSKRL